VKFAVGNNGTVVLSGQVESDSARRLATNLLRMEPGVRSVKNNLVVAEK
jgi:osmotically-inducible protein OsmY